VRSLARSCGHAPSDAIVTETQPAEMSALTRALGGASIHAITNELYFIHARSLFFGGWDFVLKHRRRVLRLDGNPPYRHRSCSDYKAIGDSVR
jgi:hypothetical protein